MLLKRQYHRDATGAVAHPPRVSHVEVKHTGWQAAQRFSTRLIAGGLADGWIVIDGQTLTLKSHPEDLRYRIIRTPGKYPSATAPSGYEVIHYYDCVLDADQQAVYGVTAKGGTHV